MSAGVQVLVGLGLLIIPIPAVNILVSSILYYVWRAETPTRARQINRIGFIVFGLQMLGLCLLFAPAFQAARKAAEQARQRGQLGGAPRTSEGSIYRSPSGTFTLRVPAGWTRADQFKGPAAEASWTHPSDLAGMVIFEPLTVSQDDLPEAVLEVLRMVGASPRRLEDQDRVVSGVTVRCVVIEATVQGAELTYIYYLYSGPTGTIQVVAAAPRDRFTSLRPTMEAFLNGLELTAAGPPAGPPAGLPDGFSLPPAP